MPAVSGTASRGSSNSSAQRSSDASLPSGDTKQVAAMLEESKREGEKRRMRITGTCLLVGVVGLVGGFFLHLQRPSDVSGLKHPNLYIGLAMMFSSLSILLLGILPSDVRAIRIANGLLLFLFLILMFTTGTAAGLIYFRGNEKNDQTLRRGRAYLCMIQHATVWITILRLMRAIYLSPRERLDHIWRVLGQCLISWAGLYLVLSLFFLHDIPDFVPICRFFGVYCFADGAICAWPNFRVRAQAFLSNRGETRLMAAAVAAAIGNHSVDEAQQKAAKLLRYVTLDKISKEELAENEPNPLLFERSVAGTFGDIDAFISHSWHDPSDDKWDGMQLWRDRFKRKYGREPRVWFDKCCIDQLSIDDSLMCLPVHLAACKTFLMIAGPTYTSRMWCIMEIFVFLAAVDDISRLECIPLRASPQHSGTDTDEGEDAPAENAILDLFRTFTVGKCQCHSSGTKDRLLSIIEAGCGTLDDFDDLMRKIEIHFFNSPSTPSSPRFTFTASSIKISDSASPSRDGVNKSSPSATVVRPKAEVADDALLFIRV